MTPTSTSSEASPLAGRRVLVTRAREQAGPLVALLRAAGAEPVAFPAIQIEPAADYAALDAALGALHRYDWAIFTSANAVAHVERRLEGLGLSWPALRGVGVAAIGPKTAGELRTRGVAVSYVPDEYVGEAIAAGLPLQPGQRVLLARADIADRRLAEGLRARGAVVDEYVAYRTTPAARAGATAALRAQLEAGRVDAVTFASASTARNLCALLGTDAARLLAPVVVACIGPVTAAAAREHGLEPRAVAREYTIEGLVAALIDFFA